MPGSPRIHVFVFSAAFPFFNNVDEQNHFDLVVKYSEGQFPAFVGTRFHQRHALRGRLRHARISLGLEHFSRSNNFRRRGPSRWRKSAPNCWPGKAAWNQVINHEILQPPLYYALAGWGGGWERAGFSRRFPALRLRFLNVFVVAAHVWLGFIAAWMIFPDNGS